MPVHVLTGRSGIGKSAFLIRPLRWLIFNQPMGDSFRRWGSAETRVDAFFDNVTGWLLRLKVANFQCHENVDVAFGVSTDYTRVSRVRSNKTNHYEMQKSTGGGEAVYKIGSDRRVPQPVADYLNMGAINFQSQHDPVYLLGQNKQPLELARVFNAMANMSRIDIAQSKINALHRKEKGDADRFDHDAERLEKDLEQYAALDDLDVAVIIAEATESDAQASKTIATSLEAITNGIKEAEEAVRKYIKVPALSTAALECNKLSNKRSSVKENLHVLSTLSTSLTHSTALVSQFRDLSLLADSLHIAEGLRNQWIQTRNRLIPPRDLVERGVAAERAVRRFGELGECVKEVEKAGNAASALEHLYRVRCIDIKSMALEVREYEKFRLNKEEEMVELSNEFHSIFPERCPLCGQEVANTE